MKEFSKQELRAMFDGKQVSAVLPYQSLDNNREVQEAMANGVGRISLSGAQTKFSMVIDSQDGGKSYFLRFAKQGEQGQYILKPAPTSYRILERKYCPMNEHLTMQIANQIFGIKTAANALCYFGNGDVAYLTRRFDIKSDGSKYAMEDFASLGGFTRKDGGSDYKYCNLSYEECAEIIQTHVKAAQVEVLKFFRVIVFNYLFNNDDAHLKNFSLIEQSQGDYVLSPSYDLMNTFIHLASPHIFALDKGLFKEGMPNLETHRINRSDFTEFGHRVGLPDKLVARELDKLTAEHPKIDELINQSLLSESLKDMYHKTYQYRRQTLLS